MKKCIAFILLFTLPLIGFTQNDTLIINNNYKWKIGVKGLFERSGAHNLTPDRYPVYNFGLQSIYKLGNSKSSLESGIYYLTRRMDTEFSDTLYSYLSNLRFRNFHFPFMYRLDTRVIYLAIGFYVDYLFNIKVKRDDLSKFKQQNSRKRTFLAGYITNIGLEKHISSQLSFFIEFESSVNIPSAMKDSNIQLVNYGLAIGVNYKILK